MKKFLFVLPALLFFMNTNAQSISFLYDTVTLNQPRSAGTLISMQDRFTNTSAVAVTYRWKMVSLTSPGGGWSFTVCDNNACAPEGVDTASFTVAAGANCIMVYDMIHHDTQGTGFGTLKITNWADTTDTKTVYFKGSMYLNTGIYDQMSDASINVYPNPVSNTVHISSSNKINDGSFSILSTNGDIVFSKEFKNSNDENFDISSLAAGNYIVILKDEATKTMLTRSIVKN